MPDKVKDKQEVHNHKLESVNENVRSFYNELTQIYPDIEVTDGRRETSPSGKFSHHHTGDALDISSQNPDVYNFLMNDRKGLELLNKYGFGVIDETDPEIQAKTNATGPHFHIGPDSYYKQIAEERYKNFDKIDIKLAYNSKSYTPPILPNSDPEERMQRLPIYEKPNIELPGGVYISQQDLAKEIEKDAIVTTKNEKSEARQELVEEQETKNTLLEEIERSAPVYALPETSTQQEQQTESQNTGYVATEMNLPNTMPQMQSLFSFD